MTKLLQWLSAAFLFLAVWLGLLTDNIPVQLSDATREVILVSPIYLLMLFACYSLAVIGYRVSIFKDCPEASEELKKEVELARADLTQKGFIFT